MNTALWRPAGHSYSPSYRKSNSKVVTSASPNQCTPTVEALDVFISTILEAEIASFRLTHRVKQIREMIIETE
jgi:hypothetical protein